MKTNVGLWIDHRKAVILTIGDKGETLTRIESGVEKHVRYSGSPQEPPEDQRDRRFASHLSKYYDKVIVALRGAESILILGPGEAKGELEDRLGQKGLSERIVGVETVDKMTDAQLAARIRLQFPKENRKLPRTPAA